MSLALTFGAHLKLVLFALGRLSFQSHEANKIFVLRLMYGIDPFSDVPVPYIPATKASQLLNEVLKRLVVF